MQGRHCHSTILHSINISTCTTLRLTLSRFPGRRPCTAQCGREGWVVASARSAFHSNSSNLQQQLQTPLSERSVVDEVPAAQVAAWRDTALRAAQQSSSAFTGPDDPSFSDLQRELRWLLEDAVEDYQLLAFHSPNTRPAKLRIPWLQLQDLWQRRLNNREPLQYLTTAAHWRDLVLAVGPGSLIPRPETEQVIDFALEAVVEDSSLGSGVWVDLGTGSGALALGLATALPGISQVCAVDSSPAACEWAGYNAQRLKVSDRVQVRQGSWFEPLGDLEGKVAGILSNPPYIEREVLPSLQAEVRLHEPSSALDGGSGSGMDCLEHICSQAARYLKPGGFLAMETGGPHQTLPVSEMLADSFRSVQQRKDIFGVTRFVTALRA